MILRILEHTRPPPLLLCTCDDLLPGLLIPAAVPDLFVVEFSDGFFSHL